MQILQIVVTIICSGGQNSRFAVWTNDTLRYSLFWQSFIYLRLFSLLKVICVVEAAAIESLVFLKASSLVLYSLLGIS